MEIFIKCILLFILFVKRGCSDPGRLMSIGIGSEDKIGLCTKNALLFWDFTWQFFKGRYGVIVRDFIDASPDLSDEIITCSMQDNQLPIRYIQRGWNDTSAPPVRSAIFRNRTVDGFIFITQSGETFNSNMDQVKKIKENVKTVLILTDATTGDSTKILKTVWRQYHALNFVIIRIIKTVNSTQLFISLYNPFIIKNGTRGFVYTYRMQGDQALTKKLMNIMNNRLKDVHGYPLKVCIYEFRGVAAVDTYENGTITKYKLQDGEIIDAIVKTINFKPVYFAPRDGQESGYKLSNGSFTGSLLELETGNADILANAHSIRDYGTENSEFLFSIDEVEFAFITPNMHATPTVSFVEIFSLGVSIALGVTYIITVITWWSLQKLRHGWKRDDREKTDFIKICYVTFGNFLLNTQRGRVLNYERCLFTGWTFFSIITGFTYQATMVEHLTTSFKPADIQSLDELADTSLTVFIAEGIKSIMENIAENEEGRGTYTRLLEHSEVYYDANEVMGRVAYDRDAAMMTNVVGCRIYQQQLYSNKTKKNLVHILEAGPPDRYSAQMISLRSPYKTRFNQILRWIRQAGLMPKWSEDVLHDLKMKSAMRSKKADAKNSYSMDELYFIFYTWLACVCFCCFVFLVEVLNITVFMKKIKKKIKLKQNEVVVFDYCE